MTARGARRIPSLDGLRAVAILMVVGYHAAYTVPGLSAPWLRFAEHGAFGVDVFFVISGYLITALLLRERKETGRISIRRFYERRAFRILPAYLVYLLAVYLLCRAGFTHAGLRDWVGVLTFTQNFLHLGWTPFGHVWSLSVEEHFYLVWPLALSLLGVFGGRWIAFGCLLSQPALRWLMHRYAPRSIDIDYATFTRLDGIALGSLVAMIAGSWPVLASLRRRSVTWLVALTFTLLISLFVLSRSGTYVITVGPMINAVATCAIVWIVTAPEGKGLVFRFLNAAPLAWIGILSYSLYLWQQLFLDRYNTDRWACRFPQNIGLAFACAIASFYLVERPFLAMKSRLGSARSVGVRVPELSAAST